MHWHACTGQLGLIYWDGGIMILDICTFLNCCLSLSLSLSLLNLMGIRKQLINPNYRVIKAGKNVIN
jgi:hypothetical protein